LSHKATETINSPILGPPYAIMTKLGSAGTNIALQICNVFLNSNIATHSRSFRSAPSV